ncbi:MAG: carboxypeptidase-like regulatory domain-containing protein, partial [Dysgonamonadaceae bacterium]|nr:carboxypeptidase-like regulatory domain-containing protein [Dysgonamonadaceae bacterium]
MKQRIVRNVFIAMIILILPQLLLAQNKEQLSQKIRGVVTDEASGQSLPYVTVLLDNTQTGTTTDENGAFILSNVP